MLSKENNISGNDDFVGQECRAGREKALAARDTMLLQVGGQCSRGCLPVEPVLICAGWAGRGASGPSLGCRMINKQDR